MNKKFLSGALVSVAALTTVASISYGQAGPAEGPSTPLSGAAIGHELGSLRSATKAPSADEKVAIRAAASQSNPSHGGPTLADLDIDGARVVVDNAAQGRWVVMPTSEGAGFCLRKQLPAKIEVPAVVSCAPGLPEAGFTWGIANSGETSGVVVSGLVADDIESVSVTTESGSTIAVDVEGNTYAWEAPNRSDLAPTAITFAGATGSTTVDLTETLHQMATV